MSKANPARSRASWGTLLFLGSALLLVLHALAIGAAHTPALQLVLGKSFYVVTLGLIGSLVLVLGALALEWSSANSSSVHSGLAPLRWSLTVCIASAALFLVLVQPFQRIWFDLAMGMSAGGLALFVLLQRCLQIRWPAIAKALDVLSFSLCLGALGVEVGLRAWATHAPSPMTARVGGGPSELVQRFRCEPGEVRYGFACNSSGYYDEEFKPKAPGQAKRIVSIGDSFSVGVVPHSWHYTTITESLTGYQVDNFGVAGIGPPEYLSLLVEEALPLNPDSILISLFMGNDLCVEDTLKDLPDAGLRAWLQRDQVLLFVIPDRRQRLALERQRLGQVDRESTEASAQAQTKDQAAASFPWVANPLLEEPSLSVEAFLKLETQRALDICAQSPVSLDLLFESLLAARRAAGNIPIHVMLIPDEFQVEDQLWQSIQAQVQQPLERARPQRLLNEWLKQHNFPTLDLLPVLRAVAPLGDRRKHVYHERDTHFNARGNEACAQALAEFLKTHE
jgi:hypothetical protein